jgi:hypothetical protein
VRCICVVSGADAEARIGLDSAISSDVPDVIGPALNVGLLQHFRLAIKDTAKPADEKKPRRRGFSHLCRKT